MAPVSWLISPVATTSNTVASAGLANPTAHSSLSLDNEDLRSAERGRSVDIDVVPRSDLVSDSHGAPTHELTLLRQAKKRRLLRYRVRLAPARKMKSRGIAWRDIMRDQIQLASPLHIDWMQHAEFS
jgi:hypothetical protein